MGKKVFSNVLWKFAESTLSQIVSLVISIILARILLPEDYGAVAMVMIFIAIADVFVTSGIPAALIQKKDADIKDFSSVFFLNICISLVLYIVLFVFSPCIANYYNMEILEPVIKVLGLRIIIASIQSIQSSYVSKKMMFKLYFWSTLSGTVLSGAIGLTMAYSGYGVWALVMQNVINICVCTIFLWFTVKWRPILYFSWTRIKTLFNFGWKILVEGFANTIATEVNSLIIGKVYSPSDLAFYKKGDTFPRLITDNINISISSVLFPAMSNEQEDANRVKYMLRQSTRFATYVVFPILTVLAVISEPLVSVVYTDKWLPCVPYIQIFCLTRATTVGMVTRHQALNSKGRSDVYMIEHIFSRVVTLIILSIVFRKGVMAVALTGVIGSVIMMITVAFTSKHYSDYKYKEQLTDVLPTIIGCVLMGIPAFFVQKLPFSNIVILAIQITIGLSIYLLFSILFKIPEFYIALDFIKKAIDKVKHAKRKTEVEKL